MDFFLDVKKECITSNSVEYKDKYLVKYSEPATNCLI